MAVLKLAVSLLATTLGTTAAITRVDPIVSIKNGSYEGLYLPAFDQDIFLGIPYAQDTGGANRFRIPQSLDETWNDTRAAKAYGPGCPDYYLSAEVLHGMSENCLSINIVRPAGIRQNGNEAPLLPVMFWIHGGAYQYGGSAQPQYNLTYLVQKSVDIGFPIIGVSLNYRKGGWGNMYSIEIQGSGNTNLALRDMRLALAWVQENIGSFGGNASSVTIWGQSAGSFAVGQLVMSYGGRTDGLFHRSIQESGSATTAWCNGSDWYQPIYNKIVDQVNCSSAPDTLECLRTIDYETLYPFLNSSAIPGPGFYPTVDGDVLPNYPSELLRAGRFAHMPHLYGTVSDEGTDNAPLGINTDAELHNYLLYGVGFGFPAGTVDHILELYPDDPAQGVPVNTGAERFADRGWQYKRVAAIVGDIFYHGPRRYDAKHYVKYSPTYIYRFNTRPWESTSSNATISGGGELAPAYKGVEHFSEVAFVFANPTTVGPWPEYRRLSSQLSTQWIRFAHTGNPNGPGLPHWPQYDEAENGLNLVLQTEAQGGSYVEDDTYRLAGREYLTQWSRRRHV
ncbi:alpha/beta-hydrolase [Annulohypoxylon maeteangense]|uniref:alpha/beta-hydrolase n=1 Tax=Annulohypoxylon maeteangense TaxID=1927788 RepID=UPI002008E176|nr:alpha/beta-hydrolase [Annulohypoxylon maeteangense]KAI0889472.1 alpha/beta-hydrolase [Annulohypoxylon maeteangense]